MEEVSKPKAPLPKTGEAGSAAHCSEGGQGVRGRVRGVRGRGERDSCCPKMGERWKAGSGAVMLQ